LSRSWPFHFFEQFFSPMANGLGRFPARETIPSRYHCAPGVYPLPGRCRAPGDENTRAGHRPRGSAAPGKHDAPWGNTWLEIWSKKMTGMSRERDPPGIQTLRWGEPLDDGSSPGAYPVGQTNRPQGKRLWASIFQSLDVELPCNHDADWQLQIIRKTLNNGTFPHTK
jgi:hypothetical protein